MAAEGAAAGWYRDFFGEDWLLIARSRPPEGARTDVDFVVRELGLAPGMRVLDVPCGHGRHSIELARQGMVVTGVDLSEPSLAAAREDAAATGVSVEWVNADIREVGPAGAYDAAVNLYTSFGYLESEAEDRRALAAIVSALRPGGGFLLETLNPIRLVRDFQQRLWSELDGGHMLLQETEFDPLRSRVATTWRLLRADGARAEMRFGLRVYGSAELIAMFADAGLEVDGAWGDTEGSDYGIDARRLVLRARKRAG